MSLRMENVTLTYPDGVDRMTALDDVSVSVDAGAITAVIGPSGSGKSSLLAVAAALVTPDSGEVTVAGTSMTGLNRAERTALRRERIGIVFQQPNLIASLTAVEQLQVMAHLDGRSARSARPRALELLTAVGLRDEARRRPHQLSGGQRQRVNIARALMNDPAVLLVDEPTSALDHERGAAIVALLRDVTDRQGTATVMVTHDRTHLAQVDDTIEIVDGRVATAPSAGRVTVG